MNPTETKDALAARAKALGVAIPPGDAEAVAAGADWLRACLENLRRAGLTG